MTTTRQVLELQLNDFDPVVRRDALETLWDRTRVGEIELPPQGRAVNLHCHSFFSFNGYGYSPSAIAWKARMAGLAAVGLVDFDVLDGVSEFLSACNLVGIRACAGLETRVFVPEFATREINSPGEPGIAYFMGVGFTSSELNPPGLLPELKRTAQERTRKILERVNPHLDPVSIDYERDVVPLTPAGNPTERHLCIAYDKKSKEVFPDVTVRAAFWSEKLGSDAEILLELFDDSPVFQGLIRSKLMKAGGVGYVKPEGREFPTLRDVSAFFLDAGAIPTYAWLDGVSAGERAQDELLDLMTSVGVAAVNIIPDRNWNIRDAAQREEKVRLLHDFVRAAQARALPIMVGTEINAYGQRFVDDFDAAEMRPLIGPSHEAARILYGHTRLHAAQGMGFVSDWANTRFAERIDKNAFYLRAGSVLRPNDNAPLDAIGPEMSPAHVLASLQKE